MVPPIPKDQTPPRRGASKQAVQKPASAAPVTVHQRHGDRASDDPNAESSEDKFLTSAQVKARYGGISDMWLHRRLQDDSQFPQPMIVEKRRFWRLSDLIAWERKRAVAPAPPRQRTRRRRAGKQ